MWSEGPSRAQIFDALRSRRTYAATDKIILDVRLGDAVMGQEIDAPQERRLAIRVEGTARIDEVQVVRSGEVIHSYAPESNRFAGDFVDQNFRSGPAYYYVRVRQQDGGTAWGSPIWVR